MSRLAVVTGGAGFIGSHLVERLAGEGWKVRVLDDFSSGRDANLEAALGAAAHGRIEVLRGDCRDSALAKSACAGAEVIFHDAALPSVQLSVEEPRRSNGINLDGTLAMLEAARAARVRRFVYAGSSSAYGDTESPSKTEDACPAPLSPYAAAKLAGEHYCRAFAACYGLEAVVLRYFNVYGPRQDPSSPYSGVISVFVTRLLAARAPVIHGDGLQSRDFVYVGDVVEANLRAATGAAGPKAVPVDGSAVNVATGVAVTVNELFRAVRAAVGGAAERVEPLAEPARTGDVRRSLADVTRARRRLGFTARTPLADGLGRTVEHYRSKENAS